MIASSLKKKTPWWRHLILSLLIVAALMLLLWLAAKDALSGTRENQLKQAQQSILRAVVTCYAIEGIYPPDLKYLYDNYGLVIDEERYLVDYQAFASNVLPSITVYEMGWSQ